MVAVSNVAVYSAQRRNTVAGVNPSTNVVHPTSSTAPSSLLLAPGSTPTGAPSNASAGAGARASKLAIIIGATAAGAGVALLAAIALTVVLLRRRRRARRAQMPEPPPSPKSFVQRPASDASGAFGRPAIPRSVLKPALEVVLEDPFDERRARADPFADPAAAETRFVAAAQRTTPSPVPASAAGAHISMRAPMDYLGLPWRSPSLSPSSADNRRTSRWSYNAPGSGNPFLVPWDEEGQRKSRASPV
jgi:hypothetical protein